MILPPNDKSVNQPEYNNFLDLENMLISNLNFYVILPNLFPSTITVYKFIQHVTILRLHPNTKAIINHLIFP